MNSSRDLHDKILAFEGDGLFERILRPWIQDNKYNEYNFGISDKAGDTRIEIDASPDDLCELYALTRVLDLLTLRFQPDNKADGSEWKGPEIDLQEYKKFCGQIGLEVLYPDSFNTFNCEIIQAIEGEGTLQIIECFYPAVKRKNIMIKRAGIKIALDPTTFNIERVNTVPIYWAYRRKNRPYFDLSQGWGNNSQWNTQMRVDIETDGSFIYNQNGKLDLTNITPQVLNELKEQRLELYEAIELAKYRHFFTSNNSDKDLFPYDFRYAERKD